MAKPPGSSHFTYDWLENTVNFFFLKNGLYTKTIYIFAINENPIYN